MEIQLNIGLDQLIKVVKELPPKQLRQLLIEIEKGENHKNPTIELEELLLNGPIATKRQLETIANNRKTINEWQKNNIA